MNQANVHTTERDQFLAFLRARGQRVTGERLVLFDEIFRQHTHIDAEKLLASLKAQGLKISRATVYRTLNLLVECGFATRQRLGGSSFVYEHVHEGLRHFHLVCTSCGRVAEFLSPAMGAMLAEICRAHGFSRERGQLQVTTLCNACAGPPASPPESPGTSRNTSGTVP